MTTHVQPKELKPGDTVDVLLKGLRVESLDSDGDITFASRGRTPYLPHEWLTDVTITRRDPPIEVGDRVRDLANQYFNVEAVVGEHVLCADIDSNVPFGRNLANLTLVSKASKAGGRV